jgi:hypothetical protein
MRDPPPGEPEMVNWKGLFKGIITSIGAALSEEPGFWGKIGRLAEKITDEMFEIITEIFAELFDDESATPNKAATESNRQSATAGT